RRLVVVLLEEHPLKHLRTLVAVRRHEGGAFAEVRDDRVRLGERAAVVEYEGRNTERRVQPSEKLRARRAIDDVDLPSLVRQTEVREEQPDLVAVARDRAVVQKHSP